MKRFGTAFLFAIVVSLTMACNLLTFFGQGVPGSAASSDTLMTLQYVGGMCVYGACDAAYTISEDGKITYTRGDGTERSTELTDAELAALADAIADADYAALTSEPFTDTCPIAYDGQELIYTFYAPTGVQVIDSCVTVIQEDAPLFQTVNGLIGKYGNLAE